MTKMSSLNYMELCRLCLVKEKVSVPIFEGEGGERQIFDKIATCLPVKVSQDDKLPKKICSDCVYRVENSYQFWNTTSNSEKQLLEWVVNDDVKVDTKSNLTMETEQLVLKEETIDHDQTAADVAKSLSRVEAVLTEETGQPGGGVSEEEEEEEDSDDGGGGGGGEDSNSEESGEEPPGKEEIESEEEEEEEEPYEELEPTTFVNVSLACDEAGPSGIQQTRQQTKQDSQASAASASATTENAEAPSTSAADPAASGSPSTGRVDFSSREMMNAFKSSTESILCSVGFNQEEIPPHPGYISHQLKEEKQQIQSSKDFETMCTGTMDIETITIKTETIPFNEPTDMDEDNLNSYSTEVPKFSKTSINNLKVLTNPMIKVSQARSSTTTLPNAFPPSEKIKPNLPTCGICNKFFATYLALKNHNNTHNLCALPTTSQNSLPSEQIKPNLPTCDICNKFFATYRALKKHNKTHDLCALPTTSQNSLPSEQIKPNLPSCEPCNKFFSGYRALKEHNKTHGYMKSCNICSKTFKFACQLKLHIQIHDKARPKLFCNLCSFSTLRKDSLLTHRRTHMIENLYVCDICRKGFHRIGYLVKHLKVHAGKEPLKCDICGLTFLLRNKLSYHKKTVHKKSTKILCTLCNKECANQFKWRQHMRGHKKEIP